jgi:hypothetical protein
MTTGEVLGIWMLIAGSGFAIDLLQRAMSAYFGGI